MKKLARYLKPFSVLIFLAVLLLLGQAMCDLNLPNYMSNIVNVGIQQNGIEHSSPEAISCDGMLLVQTFMTEDQISFVNQNYELVSSTVGDKKYEKYLKKYPLLLKEDIYVLENTNNDAREKLDVIFSQNTYILTNVLKSVSSQMSENDLVSYMSNMSNLHTEDLSALKITDLYKFQPVLNLISDSLTDENRTEMLKTGSSLIDQSGTVFTKFFYEELGINLSETQNKYILKTGLLMLLIALFGGIATVSVSFLSSRISSGVARNLRKDVFDRVESFSLSEFDKFSTASLITRTTNDVTQIQMLLTIGIRMICYAPIMGIGGIFMALKKSSSMGWIIALACILLSCLIITVFIIAMPKFKLIQKLIDRVNLVSRENLNGLMVTKAFGNEKFESNRFDKANVDLTEMNLFVNRVMVFLMPAMNLIMNGVTLMIVWIGAHQIASSNMQIGDMMAFMQYALQIISSFLMISMMFIMVPRAAVSAERISEVLSTEPSVKDPDIPKNFCTDKKGYIEFKNVSFRYGNADKNVLEGISFTAMPKQTTAFIGATGSGKSTLINLIPRFYDVSCGEVLVNGVNVKDVSQHDLRDQIGYVPQKGVLLSGSIESNLKYGDENACEEEIKTAASIAQAMDFINEKAEGFSSPIAQGGTNVSGGQKQRLSIARALVKKPSIYIFDDSFSALDFKTDAKLRAALKEYTEDSTVLIVAQRVSTIMNADQIIVLDNGKIVGKGTHHKLLKTCSTYFEIASSQLSKEELM